jgi:hypothetical protein
MTTHDTTTRLGLFLPPVAVKRLVPLFRTLAELLLQLVRTSLEPDTLVLEFV